LHLFFTTKPAGEAAGLELSLTGDIIAGLYSGTLKVEAERRAYTEFILTFPKV
jgi:signal transduction histidine kinase